MDTLWRTHDFSGPDYRIFQTPEFQTSEVTVLFTPNEEGNLFSSTLSSERGWMNWFRERKYLYDLNQRKSAASIL
jgi:hypothetical protein